MTRDDILEAAREADAANDPVLVTPFLERFATIIERKAAAAEREACLNACATVYYQHIGPLYGEVRYGIAKCDAAIRARNNKEQP